MSKATTSARYRDPLADRDVGLFESFVDSQSLLILETRNDKNWEQRGHTAHKRGAAVAPSISSGIGLT